MSIALCSSSGGAVDDVGENVALGGFADVVGVAAREQRDHCRRIGGRHLGS
jgi:hypothetical protein